MATNSGSSNPIGEETGPITGKPPSVPSETVAALKNAANDEATGSHESGQDAGSKVDTSESGGKKVKTEKERTKAI